MSLPDLLNDLRHGTVSERERARVAIINAHIHLAHQHATSAAYEVMAWQRDGQLSDLAEQHLGAIYGAIAIAVNRLGSNQVDAAGVEKHITDNINRARRYMFRECQTHFYRKYFRMVKQAHKTEAVAREWQTADDVEEEDVTYYDRFDSIIAEFTESEREELIVEGLMFGKSTSQLASELAIAKHKVYLIRQAIGQRIEAEWNIRGQKHAAMAA